MTNCFIIDIYTNPQAIVDLQSVILNNIQGRLGVSLDSIAGSDYTLAEKAAVNAVISRWREIPPSVLFPLK